MTADELRAWRQRLQWTQAQAAKSLGIRPPYYRELESGRRPIRDVYSLACATLERQHAAKTNSKGEENP